MATHAAVFYRMTVHAKRPTRARTDSGRALLSNSTRGGGQHGKLSGSARVTLLFIQSPSRRKHFTPAREVSPLEDD